MPFISEELNATIETIPGHRSVRAYTDQALKPTTLEMLVAAVYIGGMRNYPEEVASGRSCVKGEVLREQLPLMNRYGNHT